MNQNKIDDEGLKFDEDLKGLSLSERLDKDRHFYNKKYKKTDFSHSNLTDRAFIKTLITKYSIKTL